MGYMNASAISGFEAQLQSLYLFRVTDIEGSDIIEIAASSGTAFLPNMSNEEVEIPHLNGRTFRAGRQAVEPGVVTCADFIDLAVMDSIQKWRNKVQDPETGVMGYYADYAKDAEIILLDPAGEEKRRWTIIRAWPQAVNFGTLDAAANDKVNIEMTIRYEAAIPTKLI